jgi:hypothetical protein
MAICTIVNWAVNFVISFYFLTLVASIGRPATFWIYAGFGVVATAFFAIRVPETKGRSLEQIERELGAEQQPTRSTTSRATTRRGRRSPSNA